ncbi:MAG TPA: hypothetical protein DC047_11655 [Blastocatellia bacterium]|nr:hypothetical protein [Blastocatellia bacterium]
MQRSAPTSLVVLLRIGARPLMPGVMRFHFPSKTIATLTFHLVLFGSFALAQESVASATKFDEFSPRYIDDMKARLQNFSDEGVNKHPESKVYVIGYDGRRRRLKVMFRPESIANWLIEALGVPRNRIVLLHGRRQREPWVELWLVPPGAAAPKPKR